MKLSFAVPAVAVLSSFTAAIPFQKRDMVMVTKTQLVMTTVEVVKTVWADPNSAPSTNMPEVQSQAEPTQAPHALPKPPKLVNNPIAPAPQASPSTISVPSASPAPAPANTPHAPPKPAPAAPSAPAPPPSSPSTGGSGGSGGSFSGDGTYYAVGLGSCGLTSSSNENVVALSTLFMKNGANPNDNPYCGRSITISYGGVTEKAKVVDTCVGCSMESIDMSTGLFKKFSPMSVGRLHNVAWHWD